MAIARRQDFVSLERNGATPVGYGFATFDGGFTVTPKLGFGVSDTAREYCIGWRLTPAVRGDPGLEINLDAMRRESANGGDAAEHGVIPTGAMHW